MTERCPSCGTPGRVVRDRHRKPIYGCNDDDCGVISFYGRGSLDREIDRMDAGERTMMVADD